MAATESLRVSVASLDVPQARLSPVVTLYLFCVVVSVYFYVGPLYLNTLRVLLLILVIPLGVQLLRGRFGRVMATDWLFAGYVAWTVPALVLNSPGVAIQQIGSTGPEFLGGYLVGRAYVRTRADFIALCRQLSTVVVVLLPFAVLEARSGDPLIPDLIRSIPGLFSVPDVNIPGRLGLNRVQNAFNHPIHYGLFCSVVFSLNFVALQGHISFLWRWVSSVLIALGCFLALSSGALLALVLQLGLILWAFGFRSSPRRWWLLLGLGVLSYVVVDVLSDRTPFRVFLSYATMSPHTAYWRALIFEHGLQNALANPLFGVGLRDWARPVWMVSDSMDNFWLVVAVRYGFPAAALLMIGYGIGLFKVMFRSIEADTALWRIRRAWVFCFVALTFTLSTVHIWASLYSFVFFMFGAGVWLVDTEDDRQDAPQNAPRRALPYTRFAHVPREIRRRGQKLSQAAWR